MNYEDKYKEALERAKTFQAKYGGDYAEYIFPELRESEDERIRKWIHKYIAVRLDDAGEFIGEYREALAWLEKQKGQKPCKFGANAYFTPEQKPAEWSEEDEKMLEGTLMWLDDLEKQGEYVEKERLWLKSLRPVSKESLQSWKPAEELITRLEQWLKDKQFDGDLRSVYPIFESLYKLLKLL